MARTPGGRHQEGRRNKKRGCMNNSTSIRASHMIINVEFIPIELKAERVSCRTCWQKHGHNLVQHKTWA